MDVPTLYVDVRARFPTMSYAAVLDVVQAVHADAQVHLLPPKPAL